MFVVNPLTGRKISTQGKLYALLHKKGMFPIRNFPLHGDMLKYMAQFLCCDDIVELSSLSTIFDTLKVMMKTTEITNSAFRKHKIGILKWLHTNNIHVSFDVAYQSFVRAIQKNDCPRLQMYIDWGLYPKRKEMNTLAELGNMSQILFWDQYGFLPDRKGADEAAINNHENVVRFLAKKHIFPHFRCMNRVAQNGNFGIIQFLAEFGLIPDGIGVNWALGKGHRDIARFMRDRFDMRSRNYFFSEFTDDEGEVDPWIQYDSSRMDDELEYARWYRAKIAMRHGFCLFNSQ